MDKRQCLIHKPTHQADGKKLWSIIAGFLNASDKPIKITVEEHKKNRSVESNKLQRKWMTELYEQGDLSTEEYRGYCKLHFGVAIAKENEDFDEKYKRLLSPFTYIEKLELMMVPIDMPVTRIFDTKQMHRYLNKIYEHFSGLGFELTLPVDKYWESVFTQGDR